MKTLKIKENEYKLRDDFTYKEVKKIEELTKVTTFELMLSRRYIELLELLLIPVGQDGRENFTTKDIDMVKERFFLATMAESELNMMKNLMSLIEEQKVLLSNTSNSQM